MNDNNNKHDSEPAQAFTSLSLRGLSGRVEDATRFGVGLGDSAFDRTKEGPGSPHAGRSRIRFRSVPSVGRLCLFPYSSLFLILSFLVHPVLCKDWQASLAHGSSFFPTLSCNGSEYRQGSRGIGIGYSSCISRPPLGQISWHTFGFTGARLPGMAHGNRICIQHGHCMDGIIALL